ncbi:hypothetical protein DFP73DRAFT_537570, partial [Morchella snyderi]
MVFSPSTCLLFLLLFPLKTHCPLLLILYLPNPSSIHPSEYRTCAKLQWGLILLNFPTALYISPLREKRLTRSWAEKEKMKDKSDGNGKTQPNQSRGRKRSKRPKRKRKRMKTIKQNTPIRNKGTRKKGI